MDKKCCETCNWYDPDGVHPPLGWCEMHKEDAAVFGLCRGHRGIDQDAVVRPMSSEGEEHAENNMCRL